LSGPIKNIFVIRRRNPQSEVVLVMGNGNDPNRKNLLLYRDELILALDLLFAYSM
jgi:hypothetical protein